MLETSKEINGSTMNISLKGVLDSQSSPSFKDKITESLDSINEINIDFADLEYLTSAGLRVILMAQQEMDEKDGTMTLKHVSQTIKDIFKMTGFMSILTIID